MAVIGSIRRRSGLLIIIIGLAMLAFILGDIFGSGGGGFFSREEASAGEIGGQPLSIQDLERKTAEWSNLYGTHYRNPISQEQARQIAWDDIQYNRVLKPEMEKVGISMPFEEYDDIRFGEGVLDEFKSSQNFKGEDGNFDPSLVRATYENLMNTNEVIWNSEKYRLARKQMTNKYNRLISKAVVANSLDAADSYQAKNSTVDLQYVYKPYTSIADSTVTVTDSDLRAYFNAHKDEERYKQVAGRDMELVSFEVEPSAEDIKFIREEVAQFAGEFENATNDSVFCIVNSDVKRYSKMSYTRADMDSVQANEVFAASIGDVVGPYDDGNTIKLFKVIGNDQKEEASVRHILIKSDANNDDAMKAKADSILRAIKRGADFEEMVTEFSDDPGSVSNGGKYEWFPRGQMVKEFEDFSFDKSVGSLGVVKTNFGYHIIEVLDQRSEPQRTVAEFIKNIVPSSETFDLVYEDASAFALDVKNVDTFRELAKEKGYNVKQAAGIRANARSISGISNAREVVKWAYDSSTKVGDITEPMEIDDRFVVGVLTGSREEGAPVFEDIKDDLEAAVIQEKKAEMMKAEIGTSYSGLDEVSNTWGVKVQSAQGVSLSNPNLTGAGSEPKVVGTAFGFNAGDVLLPIEGNRGVYVVQVDNVNSATTENVDLTNESRTVQSSIRNTVNSTVSSALNKAMGVKNEIDRIY
jgi:peptidyl-prolyl cis-trans isomerase D